MYNQDTADLLEQIRQRATEYCLAAYKHGTPDYIIIGEDGDGRIHAKWNNFNYNTGAEDVDEYFSVEKLTEDLDTVRAERLEKEQIEKDKRIAYENEQKIVREKQDKERRRTEYLKLKKEFE